MQRIAALIANLPMQLGELPDRFLAILAPFLPPAHYPLQPFELLERAPPKEVRKGRIQIPQGFLRGTFGDLVHPGDLRLLEEVELPMQRDGGGALLA